MSISNFIIIIIFTRALALQSLSYNHSKQKYATLIPSPSAGWLQIKKTVASPEDFRRIRSQKNRGGALCISMPFNSFS